ncbi:PadR family transcriptional regulator [Coralloluteibacterium stylophorae]|uniref:PadR family transcriptional regulator n=1 Tax=Coralloluteibacterium stylophorae TaxID=1776034 RepID=A0A8J7VTY8_9GAMM|nr:PadR family transcriptional regulator [Coralloluteibacterium stylophorae]MBS7456482.1 PadR family transcriptional regulator [Coralloluteibacterium stylophorae]
MHDIDAHRRKFEKELAAGTTSLVLLAVLAAARQPMYGYEIARRLETAAGVVAGKQSALYPVLRNLAAAGLLDSHVEPSASGPPRRYYAITATGRGVLRDWTASWSATRRAVDFVLKGVPS